MNDDNGNKERKKKCLRRLTNLEAVRKDWEAHYRDLATHFLPRRSRFLNSGDHTNKGDKLNKDLIDSTGLLSVRTLASGMQSGLTSPARPWFRLGLQDDNLAQQDEAKTWLHDTQEKMVSVFSRSNFYDSIHMLYHELAVFGTGALIVEEDPDTVIRCRCFTVGEYALDTSASGRVNAIYRRLRMTAKQIVETWEDCPQRIKDMADKDNGDWIDVLHAVEPNDKKKDDAKNKRERAYTSIYMLLSGGNEVLEDGGYYEFPALCPRWDVTGSDIYGRSPAMDALSDCRMLQKMQKTKIEALIKEVNPPLAVYGGQDVYPDISPGAINYVSSLAQGQQAIAPLYQVRSNLQALEGTTASIQNQIKQVFFNDLFLMISQVNRQMTATEVAERNSEKMLLLGPVLDRLRSELFQPLIERVFGIMQRNGMISPPPEILQGLEIKIEFVSILAQAQKQAGIAAVQQVVGFVGQSAALNPEIIDKLDLDEAVDQVSDMLGVPPKLIRSDEAVAQIRQGRAAQQAQMQQMQQMQQGVDMAGGATKAMQNAGLNIKDLLGGGQNGEVVQ
ncbi:portal protein [Desulfovibrio litoralis]|uniref:Bacteriophage head to tail connecting protein n=1 Tax=Desulfovibrio litoralis DSM 11393 TaxID=1121455 RepID=A0A1M7T7W7_9BACT|nr:portal protein [Desulfovibrio litoralis]SHN66819.1 Bacteriophage head to tail connecting protein [Desulfovibrio litoralis DSM 11393]